MKKIVRLCIVGLSLSLQAGKTDSLTQEKQEILIGLKAHGVHLAPEGIVFARYLPGKQKALIISTEGSLRVWNLKTGVPVHTVMYNAVCIESVIDDGEKVIVTTVDGKIRTYCVSTGELILKT